MLSSRKADFVLSQRRDKALVHVRPSTRPKIPRQLILPPIDSSSSALSDLLNDSPIQSAQPYAPDPEAINDDNRPCSQPERTWTQSDFFAFWVAMVVCIPTFLLSTGLILEGFSAMQALFIILLGTLLTLAPMLASAHPGTKVTKGQLTTTHHPITPCRYKVWCALPCFGTSCIWNPRLPHPLDLKSHRGLWVVRNQHLDWQHLPSSAH